MNVNIRRFKFIRLSLAQCLQIDGNVLLSMPSATGDDPKLKKLEEHNKKLTSSVAEYQQIVAVKDQVNATMYCCFDL